VLESSELEDLLDDLLSSELLLELLLSLPESPVLSPLDSPSFAQESGEKPVPRTRDRVAKLTKIVDFLNFFIHFWLIDYKISVASGENPLSPYASIANINTAFAAFLFQFHFYRINRFSFLALFLTV
jgi:hypothetical protein